MAQVFEPCTASWRGLGTLEGTGLRLRPELAEHDAAQRFQVEVPPPREPPGCLCGSILTGEADPIDCPLFGTTCTPDDPVGACMVSSEERAPPATATESSHDHL